MGTRTALAPRDPADPSTSPDVLALSLCLEAISASPAMAASPLLARAGVLQLRLGSVREGTELLLRASARSAQEGFRNTALALSQRALKANPSDPALLRRIAELSAVLGYRGDARRALSEYLSRVELAGDAAAAAGALRLHLSHFPDDLEVRRRLEELPGYAGSLADAEPPPLQAAASSAGSVTHPPAEARPGSMAVDPDLDRYAESDAESSLVLLQTGEAEPPSSEASFAVAPLEGLESGGPEEPWADTPSGEDPLPLLGFGVAGGSDYAGAASERYDRGGIGTLEADEEPLPLLGQAPEADPWAADPFVPERVEHAPANWPPASAPAPENGASPSESAVDVENVDAATNHYDLAVAYKEMGLWTEAIKQLKLAIEAGARLLPVLELLGECYLGKGNPRRAVEILEHAVQLPDCDPDHLIGVHYWLREARQRVG